MIIVSAKYKYDIEILPLYTFLHIFFIVFSVFFFLLLFLLIYCWYGDAIDICVYILQNFIKFTNKFQALFFFLDLIVLYFSLKAI